jgi:hypothetical protein
LQSGALLTWLVGPCSGVALVGCSRRSCVASALSRVELLPGWPVTSVGGGRGMASSASYRAKGLAGAPSRSTQHEGVDQRLTETTAIVHHSVLPPSPVLQVSACHWARMHCVASLEVKADWADGEKKAKKQEELFQSSLTASSGALTRCCPLDPCGIGGL